MFVLIVSTIKTIIE